MLFNLHHNIKRYLLIPTFLVSVLSLGLILLSPNTYATTEYENGLVTITGKVCTLEKRNIDSVSRNYYNCYNQLFLQLDTESVSASADSHFIQHGSIKLGDYSDLKTQYNNKSCAFSVTCYFIIDRISITPKYDSDNYDYVEQGEYYFLRFITNHYPYFGDANPFYPEYQDQYIFNYSGLDAYIDFNTSTQYDCLDLTPACDIRLLWDHDYSDVSLAGNFSSITVTGEMANTLGTSYTLVNNPYDRSTSLHTRNPYDSVLYNFTLPHVSTGVTANDIIAFDFYFEFASDSTPFSTGEGGINPDDNPDWGIIQDNASDANNSNAVLGNISLPIFNPISSFLGLFTDTQCITISQVPSWFGLPSQYLCSPWKDPIRSIVSGVMVFAGTMLTFGFVISWLRGGTSFGRDVDGLERYWFE